MSHSESQAAGGGWAMTTPNDDRTMANDYTAGRFELPGVRPSPHACPVCSGTGLVSRPPHIAGDVTAWYDTGTGPYPCRACVGVGVLWR